MTGTACSTGEDDLAAAICRAFDQACCESRLHIAASLLVALENLVFSRGSAPGRPWLHVAGPLAQRVVRLFELRHGQSLPAAHVLSCKAVLQLAANIDRSRRLIQRQEHLVRALGGRGNDALRGLAEELLTVMHDHLELETELLRHGIGRLQLEKAKDGPNGVPRPTVRALTERIEDGTTTRGK